MHPLFLLLACILYHVHCATITFNISQEVDCLLDNGGCAFNTPSIWNNNIIPLTNDSVVISGSGTYSSPLLVVFPEEYKMELTSLVLQKASVEMNNGSHLVLSLLELGDTALLSILDGADVESPPVARSNFTLSPSAHLYIHGVLNWYVPLTSHINPTTHTSNKVRSVAIVWGGSPVQ